MAEALPVSLVGVNKAALDAFIQGKTFKALLSVDAVLPGDANITDLTQVAAGSGYVSGGLSVTVTAVQDGNSAYLLATQPSFSAIGGSIGPYTGIAIYDVATGKLVGAYNEVAPVTILSGSAKVVQFNLTSGFVHWGDVVP